MINLKKIIALLLIIATCLTAFTSCSLFTDSGDETGDGTSATPPAKKGLVLNELVASNKTTASDNYGEYPDWIELYNGSDADIDLKNYMLSDDPSKPEKYVFPSVVIPAGGYFVVWASGRNEFDEVKSIIHLPFSISKAHEEICLFSPAGAEINRITVNDLPSDIPAALDADGKTVMLAKATPGAVNVTELYVPIPQNDIPINSDGPEINTVRINEYCTSDCITFTDSDGDFGAWAELYNIGDKEISLGGLYLSDNENNKIKWAFPDIKLGAGQYITVFMNSKDTEYSEGNDINASFTLSGDEEMLAIYNGAGVEMDKAPVKKLMSNLTYGRDKSNFDKWLFFPKATPNAANTVPGFEEIESARYPENKTLYFSEAVAVNATLSSSPDGETYKIGQLYDYYTLYDFIEIYNPTSETVNLADFYITDGKNYKKVGDIPDVTVEPGEYRVIYLDDETYYSSKSKKLYLGMGLNRYGENIYIFDKNGVCIDSMYTGRLYDGVSSGRASSKDDAVYYYEKTTPGEANDSTRLSASIASPTFSQNGGYVSTGTSVKINAPKDAVVYYTTDGAYPTKKANLYSGEIKIDKTMSIRAVAYRDGYLPSEDVSASFVVGRTHNMPVVCITSDHDNLFGGKYGIFVEGDYFDPNTEFPFKTKYTNYWQDWERPIHFDYIDENGMQMLSFNAGAKIFGQYSRGCDQKSFTVNLRDKYGPTEICYPFFEDNINVFSSLVLRNGGQDARFAHIRDAFAAKSVLGEVNVDVMDYRPVVVYINGEYFGIYDLRERVNADYIANHTGADPDKVDLIKGNSNVLDGTFDEYEKLEDFLENNSLRNEANYKKACEMVDVDELIDYWCSVIFFCNTDTGNIKFYKERTEGAKWRWILYDLDWGLFRSSCEEYNMFDEVFNPNGHGVGNSFSTLVLCSFVKNAEFKDRFIKRFAELLNTTFSEERLLGIYDSMIDELKLEMPYHIERWERKPLADMSSAGTSVEFWETQCSSLRNVIVNRRVQVIEDLQQHFDLSKSELKELGLN